MRRPVLRRWIDEVVAHGSKITPKGSSSRLGAYAWSKEDNAFPDAYAHGYLTNDQWPSDSLDLSPPDLYVWGY